MYIKSFNLSIQGASHIKRGLECQDSSISWADNDCAIAIVCDGHGGADYVRSGIGANFAATAAKISIIDFAAKVNLATLHENAIRRDRLFNQLEGSIINSWNRGIQAHYATNPFTDSEINILSAKAKKKYLQEGKIESAYGTTLLAAVMTPDYWLGIHIGDGKCVAVDQYGNFFRPIPWDEKCFLNATTSICDYDAIKNFRHFYSEELPVAIFVGSDGVDDCFNNDQQLNTLYMTILYSFATSEFETAVAELRDYLPRLSAKGSGDDVSISAILDLERIRNLKILQTYDRSKEPHIVAKSGDSRKCCPTDKEVPVEYALSVNQARGPTYISEKGSTQGDGVMTNK